MRQNDVDFDLAAVANGCEKLKQAPRPRDESGRVPSAPINVSQCFVLVSDEPNRDEGLAYWCERARARRSNGGS